MAQAFITRIVIEEGVKDPLWETVAVHGEPLANTTSLNWSHNGSKYYTIESFSRNRCQPPLMNCHTPETDGKDSGVMTFGITIFDLSIKWFQDVTNALFKRLAPLWTDLIRSCENYYVAMPSSSDLGATKTASTKTKGNPIIYSFLSHL